MTGALGAIRRFYAEEIRATSNIQSAALVDALATIERERFLPPGPWTIRGEADFQAPPRQTPDADPRHVYHNVAIAIDASRTLFNGAPGVIALAIDSLVLKPGDRVLHVGTGLGYYTAVLAACVGATGHVTGIEVDAALAKAARHSLAGMPWVTVEHGNGTEPLNGSFDAILVNAGVTHPLPSWLDALATGGRMLFPLTATMGPTSTIGKGPLVHVTQTTDPGCQTARTTGFVAIYSAIGLRDDATNTALGLALSRNPFVPLRTLRRGAHDRTDACWLHTDTVCFQT